MDVKERSKKLFEDFWNWRLEDSPEFATIIGEHAFDDKLQSYALESFEKRIEKVEEFFKETNILLEEGNVDSVTKTNLELFLYDLQVYINGMEVKGYVFAICNSDGVHLEFERLLSLMPQKTVKDFENILARFKALPKQITELIQVMQEGIKMEMTHHEVSMAKVDGQLEALQVEPDASVFYKPFLSIPKKISEKEKNDLKSRALKSLSEDVLPSFKKLQEFIKNEYFKHLRKNVAITSVPNGKEFYEACLDFHLGFRDYNAIHEAGLNEVQRITEKIERVIASLKLKMTVSEFANHIKEDKQFYFNTEKELIEEYKNIVFKKIKPKLHILFKTVPTAELCIKPDPPAGTQAYYLAGRRNDETPGTFFVDVKNLKSSPKYEMMALALHEALPGHHLQTSYCMEQRDWPLFRTQIEDRKYSEVPSRFPLHSTYVEGWGLYSEYLGYELGLYEDLHSRYGRMSFEMVRACRLVVDTGMHILGWSRERAIDFMMERVACSRDHIEKEINRYITWPGQACAYKTGEMKILVLRKTAEAELGDKFDIREFHEAVLRSAGPLYHLEKKIQEFIDKNK
ncbi:uncharacterized protein LOC129229422 [Uloborus diversus]|uniref:uncharacterized protein LOC129229422 n=1 Tax=Uloborus diversus TaxID=327109 RepID=UPI002409E5BF|nr:uncharacterized protein LOC129229422 [Uloborus diversus]